MEVGIIVLNNDGETGERVEKMEKVDDCLTFTNKIQYFKFMYFYSIGSINITKMILLTMLHPTSQK